MTGTPLALFRDKLDWDRVVEPRRRGPRVGRVPRGSWCGRAGALVQGRARVVSHLGVAVRARLLCAARPGNA